MGNGALLAPLFVEIALTFALLIWMGVLRVRAVTTGAVRYGDVALGQPNWPRQATQIANAFHNQLELPMLFYVAVAVALAADRPPSTTVVVLSWLFVVSRLAHALVHTTTNNIPRRFYAYTAGVVTLILIWVALLAETYFGA